MGFCLILRSSGSEKTYSIPRWKPGAARDSCYSVSNLVVVAEPGFLRLGGGANCKGRGGPRQPIILAQVFQKLHENEQNLDPARLWHPSLDPPMSGYD